MTIKLFDRTMPLAEARTVIERTVRAIDRVENIPLHEANGRVVARAIVAAADVPPFSRAAMDGYAVRAEDTSGATRSTPRTLQCIERVFTGQMPALAVGAGQCIEVATGAPLPAGADAVVMVEDTTGDRAEAVDILAPVRPGQNIGRRGADIKEGDTVLDAGTALNASRVGAIAALGVSEIEVYARPRVAILSTGNEVIDPGSPLGAGQIYDINKFTLAAVVSDHGGVPVPSRTVGDTIADIERAVDECVAEDLLVFSGGSSVGHRDLITDVIAAKGEILFHGIAVKPGKPTLFGRVGRTLVFGMPGYPTSCLSNAYILLAPALRQMARLPAAVVRTLRLPLATRVNSVPGRHQFYSVRIANGLAVPAFKASGDITSLSQADGYIEIDADVEAVQAGEVVEVKLF